jgi:hypothetical protein
VDIECSSPTNSGNFSHASLKEYSSAIGEIERLRRSQWQKEKYPLRRKRTRVGLQLQRCLDKTNSGMFNWKVTSLFFKKYNDII